MRGGLSLADTQVVVWEVSSSSNEIKKWVHVVELRTVFRPTATTYYADRSRSCVFALEA